MTNQIIEEKRKNLLKKKDLGEFKKALYMIDMNNGFVNFGSMANLKYNELVPEQLKMIEKFRKENELVNFVLEGHDKDALEFESYPTHCVKGTKEADLIPEFIGEKEKINTRTYYKNSINGMLNRNLQDDIKKMTNLKEIILEGVCADLCVMDFGRTNLRFLDEINKKATMFVVKNAIDTFDAPNHNRQEWLNIAYKVLAQAGAIIVDDINELEDYESRLNLR